jgi:hypothetical protein
VANATVRYYNAKRAIDTEEDFYYKYPLNDRLKEIEWDTAEVNDDDFELYDTSYSDLASFSSLPNFIERESSFKVFEQEFSDFIYHNKLLTLFKSPSLKIESDLYEELPQFKIRILQILREKKEQEIEELREKFGKKQDVLDRRYERALEKLEKEESDVSASTTNTVLSFGMTILDAFLGRKTVKRSTTTRAGRTIRNARKIYDEKDDVERAERKVMEIEQDIEDLADELSNEIDELTNEFTMENHPIEEFYIKPRRSDIGDVELILLWESRV